MHVTLRERAKEVLVRLLEVYTPTGMEKAMEGVWHKVSKELGFEECWKDEAGNYFASSGEGPVTVLLASHVDTVPGNFGIKVDENCVYGRGAVDAKGPLASMLLGASLFANDFHDVKVVVAGLVDEEGKSLGAKQLLNEGFRADHVIVGEPTGVNGIATSYRGSITLKVNSVAKGGHSSSPHVGDSALEKLLRFWNFVKSEFSGDRFEEVTSALTTINSGDWPTKLPEKAEATINIRYPSLKDLSLITCYLKMYADETGCKIRVVDSSEPVKSRLSSLTVRALIRAMLKLGLKPRIVKKLGTSDMNILKALTEDIATYGPGDSLLAHTRYEKIHVGDIEKAAYVYKQAMIELRSFTT